MSAAWREAARARWRSPRNGLRPAAMRVWLTKHSIARRSFAAEARRAPAWRQRTEETRACGEGRAGAAPATPGRATGGAMSAAAVAGTARETPTIRHVEARA